MEVNNVFYLCSLIEYIARYTSNTKKEVVKKIGKQTLRKIYDLADIYHSQKYRKSSQ